MDDVTGQVEPDAHAAGKVIDIRYPFLMAAAGLMLGVGVANYILDLGLTKSIFVSATRCFAQLLVVGYILVQIFELEHPAAVFGVASFMMLMASIETSAKTEYSFKGHMRVAMVGIVIGTVPMVLFGVLLVIRPTPWYAGQYIIPIVGMVLGATLTAVALGVDKTLQQLYEHRGVVDGYIAKGASKWEATHAIVIKALRVGLMNQLNKLSVVGIVFIPGLMTGQVLSGIAPEVAARYQIVLLYLIFTSVFCGLLVSIFGTVFMMFDSRDRLRLERVTHRGKRKIDVITLGVRAARDLLSRACACCSRRSSRYISVKGDNDNDALPASATQTGSVELESIRRGAGK